MQYVKTQLSSSNARLVTKVSVSVHSELGWLLADEPPLELTLLADDPPLLSSELADDPPLDRSLLALLPPDDRSLLVDDPPELAELPPLLAELPPDELADDPWLLLPLLTSDEL